MSYDDINAFNASLLKQARVSLKHAKHFLDFDRPDTPAFLEGRMIDMRVFTPELYNDTFVSTDLDGRTKAGKAWKAEQLELGKTIVTAAQMAKVGQMWYALTQHPIASWFLFSECADRQVQVQLTWIDSGFGCKCKGIPDMIVTIEHDLELPNGHVVKKGTWLIDLKSTSNLYPRRFSADMAKYGYDLQLAFYADGCAYNGIHIDHVGIIAIDKSVVHDIICYELTEDQVLFHGREKYQGAIARLLEAQKTDRWPGYAEDEMVKINLPEYAYSEDIELTMDGEVVKV